VLVVGFWCSALEPDFMHPTNGATEARQYVYHPILSIVSEFEYPKIPYLCCLTFLRQYTRIFFGKWESILYRLRWLIPPKIYLIHKILGHIEEKTKTIFFFICKSKYETMDFLTNKKNTDTGIRLKIKTIRYDTNTCLVSVAPLIPHPEPADIWHVAGFLQMSSIIFYAFFARLCTAKKGVSGGKSRR
jgi:hypothetical protein